VDLSHLCRWLIIRRLNHLRALIRRLIPLAITLQIGFGITALAHPASGIVVDQEGNVYFIYSRTGVIRISSNGKMSYAHKAGDGHWMCIDEVGLFSRSQPKYFERITPEGARPAIIFAGGGSPIAIGKDGNFYYCGGPHGEMNPGALTVVRETPDNEQEILSPSLEDTLQILDDGITGIAAGPNGLIYVAGWNSLLRVSMDGRIETLVHPVVVNECDSDPADHLESNRGKPLLRGLAVDSSGVVYAAATSCHCLLRITPDGRVKTILKSDRPWAPTGVALHGDSIYLLEYTNANGPATEGWKPRVRKIDKDGNISVIADLSSERK